MYDLKLKAVACGHHSDCQSTICAKSLGQSTYPVQRHLAHVWSVIGEHQLELPGFGVAWGGSGLGTDDTIWGSEFLHISQKGWKRFAHLKPFLLPGGDKAAQKPRRSALGLLYTTIGVGAFKLQQMRNAFTQDALKVLRSHFETGAGISETTSMGRLFDAGFFTPDLKHSPNLKGKPPWIWSFQSVIFSAKPLIPSRCIIRIENMNWSGSPPFKKLDEMKLGISASKFPSNFVRRL